jgi:hypothetical protein
VTHWVLLDRIEAWTINHTPLILSMPFWDILFHIWDIWLHILDIPALQVGAGRILRVIGRATALLENAVMKRPS